MNATQRQTEPVVVLEELEQRTLLSGDVMAGAIFAEPSIPGDDLNNVAIIAQPSENNTSTGGQSEQGPLGGRGEPSVSKFPFPGPTVDLLGIQHYMLEDHWGGKWVDAEKSDNDPGDDLMCWAAAASNILEWTGWGFVDGMTTTDQMFEYFQDHWTDEGGQMRYGWSWWFEGTYTGPWTAGWSQVDVPGGGFYPPPTETFGDYFQNQMIDANAMSAVDTFLHAGYGTALGLVGGSYGHAVTAWGYSYNPSDPTDYLGVWITDSDDNKSDASPTDVLAYYEVAYSNNRWYLQNYGGSNSWYIEVVDGLDRNPNHRPDLYNAGDAWSWFGPDTVYSGQPWEAHFDIRNGSTAGAGQFYVDFYASNDTTITSGDHFLGQVSISSLAPGAKADADLVLANFPISLATGSYYVGIIIDPTDNVDEFDEANNKGIDDSLLHVKNSMQARIDSMVWAEYNPIPIIPRTELPGTEYFPTIHDRATRLSVDIAAEPITLNEYLPGADDDTLGLDGGMDTLGVWDSPLRTDAELYSVGGADTTRTLDSSSQSLTMFDEGAAGDWLTNDLARQDTFADVSALEFNTFEREF